MVVRSHTATSRGRVQRFLPLQRISVALKKGREAYGLFYADVAMHILYGPHKTLTSRKFWKFMVCARAIVYALHCLT